MEGDDTFSLIYTNSDSSTNGGVSKLYVGQYCDEDVYSPTTTSLTSNDDGTEYYTTQSSYYACPIFTLNALFQFVLEYYYIFGPAFIVIGLFFALVGFKLFQVALFIVATIVVAGLLLFVCYATFLASNTTVWVGWLTLSICVVLGLLGGFLTVFLEKFAGALLSAWGGFLLGVIINETVVWLAGSVALFWIINICCAIIFFILGFMFFDYAIMLATSFIGSYMMMKGIGIMAGGFPNIYVLIKMIEDGAIDTIDPVFYAYMAGIIICFIFSAIFQYKCFLKKKVEEEQHPYQKLN